MLEQPSIPVRVACPPGACVCERERLLDDPQADRRILMLTRQEELRLVARIESVSSYDELRTLIARMTAQLGIVLRIEPSPRGVKTVFGFKITLAAQAGLCRKTSKALPAAVRKCLGKHPDIAFAILDEHDLLDPQRAADEVELDIDGELFDGDAAALSSD